MFASPSMGRRRTSGPGGWPTFVDTRRWTELRFAPRRTRRRDRGRCRRRVHTPSSQRASGRTVLDLAHEACLDALADAGLDVAEVDGVGSFMVMHDSVQVPGRRDDAGACPSLRWSVDLDLGGQAPCHLVGGWRPGRSRPGRPATWSCFRALNGRCGPRVGTMEFDGPGAPCRYPIGYDAYLMYVAMWAQRFLAETGQGVRRPRRRRGGPARVRGGERARSSPPTR